MGIPSHPRRASQALPAVRDGDRGRPAIGRAWRQAARLLAVVACTLPFTGTVQGGQWARTWGGAMNDAAHAVQPTPDGGFIVVGDTNSYGTGNADLWVLKLDAGGNVAWQRTYGGQLFDGAHSVQPTSDGGYVVAGYTMSFGGGSDHAWVLKLGGGGDVLWQKVYGSSGSDAASSVRRTADGGFVVAGRTSAFGAGGYDAWVLKLDAGGNIAWQRTFGGAGADQAFSAEPTADGGYVVAGQTSSFGAGGADAWVLKLDAGGIADWQKTYGGAGTEIARAARQTADGGYVVAGGTSSYGAGGEDLWVLRLDAAGTVVWQKTYGGPGTDTATDVRPTTDGGYVVAGTTDSFGAGSADAWVLKLDAGGNVVWQRTYGGGDYDEAWSLQSTPDGGYVVAGRSGSFGGRGLDAWVLALDANGAITGCAGMGVSTASAASSNAAVGISGAAGAASLVIPAASNVVPRDSTATALQQCAFDAAPAATEVPALSAGRTLLLLGLVGLFGVAMRRRVGAGARHGA